MRIKNILVLALATLVIWQIILPTVNSLNLPLNKTYGIISRLVIDGRSPLTNYAIYLILLLGPSFIILCSLFLRGQFIKLNLDFKEWKLFLLRITDKFRLLPVALFLSIACWLLNVKHQPMIGSNGNFVQDGFHFGEVVGLSETFLQNPGLFYDKAYLIIHGFGLNVLPGIIGLTLGGDDRDIAISGLVVDAHYTISTIFAFLIMLEIATYISAPIKWKIFSLFILVYFCLHNIAVAFLDRDIIFLIQVFISLRWVRLERNDNVNIKFNSSRFIYPALLGCFIPISFLYVYDRAIYFTFLLVYLFTYFLIIKGIKFCINRCLVTLSFAFLMYFIFSTIFGFNYLSVTSNQISYWSKYSGLFTGLAYPKINIKIVEIANWLAIFLQSCSLTILCLKFYFEYSERIKFKRFLYRNSIEIFLLLCAVITMRVALGRSADWYLTSRGFFAIFSFVTIVSRLLLESYTQEIQLSLSTIPKKIFLPSFSSVFIVVLLLCGLFNMNSVAAAVNVFGLLRYPSSVKAILSKTNSELLNSSYLEAAKQIKGEITGSCFYTLTSEGVWYRIFSMKPCSKYWYLLYSTSIESQKELVRELEAEKPNIILYSNQFWSNSIDGVPKETSHLLVHQYIWQHYRPYKMLNGNWFWIHREDEELLNLFVPSDKVVGLFEGLQMDTNQIDVLASGWSIVGKENSEKSTVFITYNLINSPNNLKFLGVGSVSTERYDVATALNKVSAIHSGWNISFNRLNVPPENVLLRAWAYNPEDHKLYEIPSASPKLVKGELPTAKRITPRL